MIDSNNNLILIKSEDKTEEIETLIESDEYYFITFYGGKTYRYNHNNVKHYTNPQIIDLDNVIVIKSGIPLVSDE